jgi:hypothetical protein
MPNVTAEEYIQAELEPNRTLRGRAQGRRRRAAEIDTILRAAGTTGTTLEAEMQARHAILLDEADFIEAQANVEWDHAKTVAVFLDDKLDENKRAAYRASEEAIAVHRRSWRRFRDSLRHQGPLVEDDVDDAYVAAESPEFEAEVASWR